MTSESLERLVKARQLKAEPAIRREFEGLLRLGRVQLEDARKRDLSLESRFDLAYGRNAAQYEGQFNVDEKLMAELLKVADAVLAKVIALSPP